MAAKMAYVTAATALLCGMLLPVLVGGAPTSAYADGRGPEELRGIAAAVADDGVSATVQFAHDGHDHRYVLQASSIYTDGAEISALTEHGEERLRPAAGRLFRARAHGRSANVRLHEDGSVTGLFERDGHVMKIRPAGTHLGLGAGAARPPAHHHHVQYLRSFELPGRSKERSGIILPRRLADTPRIAVDHTHNLTAVTGSDLPVHEVPGDHKVLALQEWAGQRWFPGCYNGDSKLHEFALGIVADPKAWEEHSEDLQAHLEDAVHQASFIYEMQMNVRLKIDKFRIIKTTHNAPSYAVGCPSDFMSTKLNQLKEAGLSFEGSTHLFTGCGTDYGTVGLAYVGTICHGGYNVGVNQVISARYGDTFLVFAHELGHNFGADHSFEDGQGQTGGIMDYGDGHYRGVYQFNSKYRKDEVCRTIDNAVGSCRGKFNRKGGAGPSPGPNPSPTPGPHNLPEGPCVTVGSTAIGSGHVCAFPFVYKGTEYHSCAYADHSDLWCATSVGDDRSYQDGQWGECSWSPSCMGKDSPCLTEGSAGVGEGHECVFPFTYMTKEFQTCTIVNNVHRGKLWCATKVDSDGNMEEWGECGHTDYCIEHWKTVGWAGIPSRTAHWLGNQAASGVDHVKKKVKSGFQGFLDGIGNFFKGIWNKILSVFGQGSGEALQGEARTQRLWAHPAPLATIPAAAALLAGLSALALLAALLPAARRRLAAVRAPPRPAAGAPYDACGQDEAAA